jgi:hypothetical protein
MVVSDGHGSGANPRSDRGSRLAVETGTRVLWRLPVGALGDAVTEAVGAITSRWAEAVRAEAAANPLTADELGQAERRSGIAARGALEERPSLAYGATLLFAVVEPGRVILGQLGDGDILLVTADGGVHRPLPADPRLIAHTTTSLCDDDPVASTRTLAVSSVDISMVVLATDGYSNSFADDLAFLQVGRDLLEAAERSGIEYIRQSLPRWLTETTVSGSGDDISVALAFLGGTRRSGLPSGTAGPASRRLRSPVSAGHTRPQAPTRRESPRAPIGRRGWLWLMVVGVLAAGLAGAAVAVASRGHGGARPAIAIASPSGSGVASATVWSMPAPETLRRTGRGSPVLFRLPDRILDWKPVANGVLVLLETGDVTHLPNLGQTWSLTGRAFRAVRIAPRRDGYVLETSDGVARWRIDPDTGTITEIIRPGPVESSRPSPVKPLRPQETSMPYGPFSISD